MPHTTASGTSERHGTLGASARAEITETHTGIVILMGDRAYKIKKPIVTDFLDFRTVQARERVCADEVMLNARLAPDSYVGVGHFAGPDGGDAEPVIVMRRYPPERALAALLEGSEPVEGCLSAVAGILARFHADARRSEAADGDARPAALAQRWNENLDVLECYPESVVSGWQVADARRLASRYLAGRSEAFEKRIGDRRIVDGHGDLLAADIFCMPDGPVILDCLEFDDHLRHVDGLDDAAFLAMDLEYRGRPDLATFFLDTYRQLAEDPAPASLVHFYTAYRAIVRAKVDCIRADQGDASAVADAGHHMRLALDHLRAGAVQLVLVGGGPGSGKTTLAHELAPRIGAVVISTDDVRHELVQHGELHGAPGTFGSGRYAADNVAAVYDAVLQRAAGLLAGGHSVILDGTWRDPQRRQAAHDVAAEQHCPAVELACVLDVEKALERIRLRDSGSRSEVTEGIAASMYHDATVWPSANHIDTTQPLSDTLAEALAVCCLAV